jgi:hypothetical protein
MIRSRVLLGFAIGLLGFAPVSGQASLVTLLDSGPTDQRINLVFLAEGFTAGQAGTFNATATSVMNEVLGVAPYGDYRSYFNVFGVFVASNESGSDHPASGVSKDTFFQSYFDCAGITRLICLTGYGSGRADSVLSETMPEYDIVVIIVNDPEYGGSGGKFAITSAHPAAPKVAIHEIGHSFARLADEYDYAGGSPREAPNATATTVRQSIKWRHWIHNSTPIPTPETSTYSSVVGLFEGAVYSATGWYRPKLDCYMQTLGVPFCEVCAEHNIATIYSVVSPIVSSIPAQGALDAVQDTMLSVAVMEPTNHDLQVEWVVDGVPVGGPSGTDFVLSASAFGDGLHVVMARVSDTTSMVLDPTLLPLLTDSTSWTVSLTYAPIALSAAVLLEGPYVGEDTMSVTTDFESARPTVQPYAHPDFSGTPLEYNGVEDVTTFPSAVIDWILVDLRTGTHDSTYVTGSRNALLLMSDGSLVSPAGGPPILAGIDPGLYHVVLRHRNHLPVLSPNPVDFTSGTGTWSFVDSLGAAYSAGGAPMKDLGDGRFAMFACDIDVDGQLIANDFNLWLVATKAVHTGYVREDCSLDGQVTASDFNLWLPNTKAVVASQVLD